jgi:hypothetical protein
MLSSMLSLLLFAALQTAPAVSPAASPFAPLDIYDGHWSVRAEHPWGGGPAGSVDRLISQCHRFTAYFACEQTVNGKPEAMLVYTAEATPTDGKLVHLHSRLINPAGLSGGRGDLTLDGNHWTYLDKPPAPLKGNWSRVENFIVDHDHIRFEEYESPDEGKTWTLTNRGTETRDATL